ncbi:hypothetical protein ACFQ4L_04905 [Lapidilactobacillus mulanensis]|uniref:Uncharacterized protein n=1 Tax=Lapidilactobacillus mulanensis TaxID=2485999 RepID=A0ABW4DR50_9LACO|nr:hypothetical protein [Lapidilactobacillus mulanensis]
MTNHHDDQDQTLGQREHEQNLSHTENNPGNDLKQTGDQNSNLHDSGRFGDTDKPDRDNAKIAQRAKDDAHQAAAGSEESTQADSLNSELSQEERHAKEQDANMGDDSADDIAKLTGDRRGLQQDS